LLGRSVRVRLVCVLAGLAVAGCAGEKAEGRPWVHRLTLDGVKRVSQSDLKDKLLIDEEHWYTTRTYLDPFTVDSDRARIEAYYQAHGYFRASVRSAQITPYRGDAARPVAVDIKFTVDEGVPTYLERVEVRGLESLGAAGDKLIHDLQGRLKVGAIFDHETYAAEKAGLEGAAQALGHAWAKVDGVVDVNRDRARARITLTATLGPLATYGEVRIRGTVRVDPRRVMLHTGLHAGDRYSPQALEEARGQIYSLGVFSSVRVEVEHRREHPEIADLVVTVKETTFNEVRVGAGFGLESQRQDAHASVTYARHNWLGGLRTLRLRIEPAYVVMPVVWDVRRQGLALTAEAVLTQPDVIWPLTQLKFTLGYDVGIEYPYQYHGPRTQLAFSRGFWRGRVRLGLSYNFQILEFFKIDATLLDDPEQAGQVYGFVNPYRLGWWQEDFALDLRDRPLDAHKGAYLGVSFEQGGVFAAGAFLYEKIAPEVRGYIPLGSRVTVALRIQFGQLFSEGDLGTPVTRRFYLGGPSSHRGFSYNRLSPQVSSKTDGVGPIPIGGDQMLLGQAEVRVNLLSIAGNWLSIAAFFDAGDVSCETVQCRAVHRGGNVQLTNLHYATGGGLRFKTVIGTLRFDVGARLNRLDPMEADGTPNPDPGCRMAYHLSVGEAF